MLDASDFGRNPHGPEFAGYGRCLVRFGKAKKGVSHVGIYVGDGRFVQASSAAGRVIETPLDRPASPRIKVWRGARRILVGDDSTASTTPTGVATKGGN